MYISLGKIQGEGDSHMSTGGDTEDDDILGREAEVVNEVFLSCDGVEEVSRERICGFEWGSRAEAVFKGEG